MLAEQWQEELLGASAQVCGFTGLMILVSF